VVNKNHKNVLHLLYVTEHTLFNTAQKRNYTVSQKNVPPLACYNFDTRERILIFFGRNAIAADKVSNQKTLHYATSNILCFCITWQNGKHES